MPKLRDILEREGISQAELSRASFVSTTTINKICGTEDFNFKGAMRGKITKGLNKLTKDGKYTGGEF